jgi:hypothetical protein
MDDMFFEAAKAVSAAGYGNNHLLRDELGVSYLHAKELIEALQDEGILGPYSGHDDRLELIRSIGFY